MKPKGMYSKLMKNTVDIYKITLLCYKIRMKQENLDYWYMLETTWCHQEVHDGKGKPFFL
jgi:hypothetical protein